MREDLQIPRFRKASHATTQAVWCRWQAAASSFVSFAVGALIPLLPWFFTHGTAAVVMSIVLGAISAVGIGWTVAVFTGRSRLRSALRQLAIATLAASVTFGVGSLVGVHTAL